MLDGKPLHILVRMFPEYKFTDDDIKKRYVGFYGDEDTFLSLDFGLKEFGVPDAEERLKRYRRFKDLFMSKKDKIPKPVAGLDGIYSLKRLTES